MIKIKLVHNLYSISSIFLVIALCWLTLYKANFFYGFWHQHGGISATISYFSPKNIHIKGFENTTKAEHIRLFKAISYAVHLAPDSLANITFTSPDKPTPKPLLHQREIVHLNDVANTIQVLYLLILMNIIGWLWCLRYYLQNKQKLPSLIKQLINTSVFIAVILIVLFIIGPTAVFYWFHQLIFPDNHQWFFYYEDSLMSTLMSAPDLFGWIALEWLILFCCYFLVLQYASIYGVKYWQDYKSR
ncbi:MAG: DUF1461 domain-containing protein [Thalassotalea sp.]